MIVGFDIDGVLANFNEGYGRLGNKKYNLPLIKDEEVPCWNWDTRWWGATEEQIRELWKKDIVPSPIFWAGLKPLLSAETFDNIAELSYRTPVFFITSRPGNPSLLYSQTMLWLNKHLGAHAYKGLTSTIVTKQKGLVCNAIGITHYIDDKFTNLIDIVKYSPKTKCFMLKKQYNEAMPNEFPSYFKKEITVVDSVDEYLSYVGV
jgi:hypothetical protein